MHALGLQLILVRVVLLRAHRIVSRESKYIHYFNGLDGFSGFFSEIREILVC